MYFGRRVVYELSLDILARGQSSSATWAHASCARMERHPRPDICSWPSHRAANVPDEYW